MKILFSKMYRLLFVFFVLTIIGQGRSGLASVDYFVFPEQAEHDHFVVAVHGMPVIILRGRTSFADVERRAHHVADHLEEALEKLQSAMKETSKPLAGFTIESQGGNPCIHLMGIEVITVHEVDALAYRKRDPFAHERSITPRLVAEFWRGLLQDVALILHGQPPTTLMQYKEMDVLLEVYLILSERLEVPPSETSMRQALDSLTPEAKKRLDALPAVIPRGFKPPTSIPSLEPSKSF